MFLAKVDDRQVEGLLAAGEIGWERTVLMALRLAGAADREVEESFGYDLAGLERLVAARRRIASTEVDVIYDVELGFPRGFTIVWNGEAADGTFIAIIDGLIPAFS